MTKDREEQEKAARIFQVLCEAYHSQGPAATTPVGLIEKETGLMREEVERGLASLASQGLVRYWELGDVVTIGPAGIELCEDVTAFARRFSTS